MERVEVVGTTTFVLRTYQLGAHSWSCDIFERDVARAEAEVFVLKEFGESELEAVAMALSDALH